MHLTIRNLSPKAQEMLEAYMESHDIPSKSKAIDKMLEDHREMNNLRISRNQYRNDMELYKSRWEAIVKLLRGLSFHMKADVDGEK
ncbi:hypothetical protein [Nonlabens xiamenensis]|uniref:hypothetical protein n=1 Tax=Nonlabens xiamenensis TaxID=2341043 RepID=UPI000F60A879|nr:hypothetical protein [Nonlabens xiamenensis]